MKILDCTLRDGGYYNDWDFNQSIVIDYLMSMEKLPVDYVELGYVSPKLDGYFGEYFYLTPKKIDNLKKHLKNTKTAILINTKDFNSDLIRNLLFPLAGKVDLIRLAVSPDKIKEARILANLLKESGFEVAFNIMYMSKWNLIEGFYDSLNGIEKDIDILYLVDSYGGVMPFELEEVIKKLKKVTPVLLGFHGHNNLEMALSNSITALSSGCEIIDSTITGMGRGAGNLKTELILTYLRRFNKINFDMNLLSNTVLNFERLKKEYDWGTNYPYMISGAYSFPQKDVMRWVVLNRYSLEEIVIKLSDSISPESRNALPEFRAINLLPKNVLIVGGGSSILRVIDSIDDFIGKNNIDLIIFTSPKYLTYFELIKTKKLLLQYGAISSSVELKSLDYVVFPYSEYVPWKIMHNKKCFGLKTAMVSPLEASLELSDLETVNNIYLIGFDGYLNKTDAQLENQNYITNNEQIFLNKKVVFLTKSSYSGIRQNSVYAYI